MIHLNLQLTNPWGSRFNPGRTCSGRLSTNKSWELQAMHTPDLLCFRVEVTHNTDHAGLALELGLLGFNIALVLYDNRHWDHITQNWK